MDFPIVSVTTKDNFKLHGLFLEPVEKTISVHIHIHGHSGNFYWNNYYKFIAESNLGNKITFLATNNRGAYVFEKERDSKPSGAALELFEDSVLDIDAWIEFILSRGYKRIILSGHSFGTEKVVYYLNKGKYIDSVIAVILLGFSDSYGSQKRYEQQISESYLNEAKALLAEGNGETLLKDIYGQAGELPISAQTYLDLFSPDSQLSQTFPLRNGRELLMYRNIKVPILAVISDNEAGEYMHIPIGEALQLLEKENPLTETSLIKNTNHGFEGKELELVQIINKFLSKRI